MVGLVNELQGLELTEMQLSRRALKDSLHYSDFSAAIRKFHVSKKRKETGVLFVRWSNQCAGHIYEEKTMRDFCSEQAAKTFAAQASIVVLVISPLLLFVFC